jgi:hypothetical protein
MTIFRFTLRTLFVGLTLVAVLFAVLAYVTQAGRKRAAVLKALEPKFTSTGVTGWAIPTEEWRAWHGLWGVMGENNYSPPIETISFAYHAVLTAADCRSLNSFPELRKLSFTRTNANDQMLLELGRFNRLATIYLEDTEISDVAACHVIENCPSISEIDLYSCKVGDRTLIAVLQLGEVRRADFRYTEISGQAAIPLLNCPIEELELEGSKANDEVVAALRSCEKLGLLNLGGCPVTDRCTAYLREMRQLWWLDLSGTQVSDDAVESLRKALPDCSIRKSN